ncbi:hypothetical protein KAU40_02335 [Candidatus Parcubacteria bacterium]|nr:hypothetical protein [Candidatus Parcubacteria bacterium]
MGKFAVLIKINQEANRKTIISAIEDAIKTNMSEKNRQNIKSVEIITIR